MKMANLGRIAFRVEGDFWNAYWTQQNTMVGAILIGSLRMTLSLRPARKNEFIELMQAAFSDIVENETGVRPVFPEKPRPAPEHERTKE